MPDGKCVASAWIVRRSKLVIPQLPAFQQFMQVFLFAGVLHEVDVAGVVAIAAEKFNHAGIDHTFGCFFRGFGIVPGKRIDI